MKGILTDSANLMGRPNFFSFFPFSNEAINCDLRVLRYFPCGCAKTVEEGADSLWTAPEQIR